MSGRRPDARRSPRGLAKTARDALVPPMVLVGGRPPTAVPLVCAVEPLPRKGTQGSWYAAKPGTAPPPRRRARDLPSLRPEASARDWLPSAGRAAGAGLDSLPTSPCRSGKLAETFGGSSSSWVPAESAAAADAAPDEWAQRAQDIEALFDELACPNALAAAVTLETLRRLSEEPWPQQPLLKKLLQRLEGAIYDDSGSVCWSSVEQDLAQAHPETLLPPRYAKSMPYFVLARQQQAQIKSLHAGIKYLEYVIARAEKLQEAKRKAEMGRGGVFQTSGRADQFVASTGQGSIMTGNGSLAVESRRAGVLRFVFGAWKVTHKLMRRLGKQKAEMVVQSVVEHLVMAFAHWLIYIVDCHIEACVSTHQAFHLEQQLLTVEANDLEMQQEDIKAEMLLSLRNSDRLLAKSRAQHLQREALQVKLEEARPELVKSMLNNVLNSALGLALREAVMQRLICRHFLASRELVSLLGFEDGHAGRLTTVTFEGLLIRWLNYHITQFKLVAAEVLDVRADDSMATTGEWSVRDAEVYRSRCRSVRCINKVTNLNEDLRDGTVFCVLFAAIVSQGSKLNPSALWLLDEKDETARAQKVIEVMRTVLPTQSAKSLLRSTDLSQCCKEPLLVALATLFLHSSKLPSLRPDDEAADYARLALAEHVPEKQTAGQGDARAYQQGAPAIEDEVILARKLMFEFDGSIKTVAPFMAPLCHVTHLFESCAGLCAYKSMQDVTRLLEKNEAPSDLLLLSPEVLLLRWLGVKLRNAPAAIGDIQGSQLFVELLEIIAPDVWAMSKEVATAEAMLSGRAPQTHRGKAAAEPKKTSEEFFVEAVMDVGQRITGYDYLYKEAFTDNVDTVAVFLAALFLARPSLPVLPGSTLKKHLDTIEAALHGGEVKAASSTAQVTFRDYCSWLKQNFAQLHRALLHIEAMKAVHAKLCVRIQDFQSDLLTERAMGTPCKTLSSREDREKGEEVQRKYVVPPQRLRVLLQRADPDVEEEKIDEYVSRMEDITRKNLSLFRDMFQHYGRIHSIDRSDDVMGGFGRSDDPSGGKRKGQSIRFAGSLSSKRKSQMPGRRRHAQEENLTKVMAVDCRGLTHLLKDCQLRKVNIFPIDMERIYDQVILDHELSQEETAQDFSHGLPFELFVEALVAASFLARNAAKKGGDSVDLLNKVIDKQYWRFSERQSGIFYALTCDPDMGPMLAKYHKVLRCVFRAYSNLAKDVMNQLLTTTHAEHGAGAKAVRSDVGAGTKEAKKETRATESMLDFNGCQALMEHAGLFGGKLDEEQLHVIFKGVQEDEDEDDYDDDDDDDEDEESSEDAGSAEDGESSPEEEEDADKRSAHGGHHQQQETKCKKISFHEWVDLLVAVAVYKDPNPLKAFMTRFERFLLESLLGPLANHWRHTTDQSLSIDIDRALRQVKGGGEEQARERKVREGDRFSDVPPDPKEPSTKKSIKRGPKNNE